MTINYNAIFNQLLQEYDLPRDLSFSVDLPPKIMEILNDQIQITKDGITLESFNQLYPARQDWENQSIIEDNENHFHVDRHIHPPNAQKAFMLGVKTLILLAAKFKSANMDTMRFWLSFQTPELGQDWAKYNNVDEYDDEHYISDRLSFYKRRPGEDIISISTDKNERQFWAILMIDI
ncbi:MAG: hypothetical protein JWM28_1363 [Chitinophagaceae bacterium]|nr:hypothetical protein [Chitinophagaceae bacterium]